jgi:lysozyme family protein
MKSLDDALQMLLRHEGGWSNHPADKGGATFNGVTQGTYDQWRAKKKLVKQSVRKASAEEIRNLYKEQYWDAARCDRLPWPISYLCFDAAVNSGVSRGVRWVQAGLGVEQDGLIGAGTVRAAEEVVAEGDAAALVRIVDARVEFLARLVQRSPSQAAFLLGWWRRTQDVLAVALTTVED